MKTNTYEDNNTPLLIKVYLNRLGLRRSRKTFAVGFNKTATSSIHKIFKAVGLPSIHGNDWREGNSWMLRSFDCFSDGVPGNIEHIDSKYPDAKFILQVRDMDAWVLSRLAHIKRVKSNDIFIKERARLGPLWDDTEEAVDYWIKERNRFHIYIMDYFKKAPERLLIVNFIRDPNAVDKILDHIGETTSLAKPHANAKPSKEIDPYHLHLLNSSTVRLGISRDDVKRDIYLPVLEESAIRFPSDTSMVDF